MHCALQRSAIILKYVELVNYLYDVCIKVHNLARVQVKNIPGKLTTIDNYITINAIVVRLSELTQITG